MKKQAVKKYPWTIKDTLLVFLLIVLTYYAWHLLPGITLRTNGLIYLTSSWWKNFFASPFFYTKFNLAAYLFGAVFSRMFGTNIPLYFWAELVVMMIINFFFYLTVRAITHKRMVAFSAALISAACYFGNWSMHTDHCYCFFLERVIEMIWLMPSLLFLHLFLERSRLKYYLISLLFYFIGIGISHFALLFTAPYLFYPFFWQMFNKKTAKEIIRGIIIGLSYLALSGFFYLIQQKVEAGLKMEISIIDYLLHPQKYDYFLKIIRQLVYWSEYPVLFTTRTGFREALSRVKDVSRVIKLTPFIIMAYIIAARMIYQKLPQQRATLFTVIFAVLTIFYMNAWFGQWRVLIDAGENRYLYFPTFLLAIFWALFLWAVFWKRNDRWRWGGIALLGCYYLVNIWLISKDFEQTFSENRPAEVVIDRIIEIAPKLEKNTLIVGAYGQIQGQEADFFTEQLGRGGEVRIMTDWNINPKIETWEGVASSSAHVVKVGYNRDCQCVVEEKLK